MRRGETVVTMTEVQHALLKGDMRQFCEDRIDQARSPDWKTWWTERLAWWEQQ